jgi:saccharopine dehydrogenase (NAD+, L-lysine-forming)
MSRFLIYGATGATGRRLAELAIAAGIRPIVAGRRGAEIGRIGDELGCDSRTASLEDVGTIFEDVAVVASCIGPYTHVGQPVLDAAVHHDVNYLDLTGEARFVERMLAEYDGPAREAGVTLVPSAGLGLTSGIAARAAVEALPGPVEKITIGYRPRGMRPSTGTLQSTVELIAGGAAVARNGEVRFVPPGRGMARTAEGLGALFPLTDPLTMHQVWPDADITGYFVSRAAPLMAPALIATWLTGRTAIGPLRGVERLLRGHRRPGGGFRVAVTACGAGQRRTATVDMDDIYELTSQAALEVARTLLGGAKPGVQASGSVVDDPEEVAERIGVRLSVTEHPGTGGSPR